jgi:hypothetical protein
MREAVSAHPGMEHVDMASGQIRASGSVCRVNVDAQVKLHRAAIREVAKLRKLLAELGAGSEKDPRPVADEIAAAVGDEMRRLGLPATPRLPMLSAMFVVTEAEAAAIRAVFEQRGEFAAAVELRRRFPGITDNAQARECARTIASWKPQPLKELPKRPRLRL